MKRTNLVLDEKLLHEARVLLGLRTYSEAVNKALEQTIKTIKIRGMLDFFGKDVWNGDLSEMREDSLERHSQNDSH